MTNMLFLQFTGCRPEDGVRDMIVISDIDEHGINKNLWTRYTADLIYVSFRNDGLICFSQRQ